MKAHIQIVGYNHEQYLGTCIRSCLEQSVQTPIIFIDNNSKDDSVKFIQKEFPNVLIIKNQENRGYSGAHNDGFKAIPDSENVIVLNPDIILKPDFVEQGLKEFNHDSIGAVAPLLTRRSGKNSKEVIDAFGDRLLPSLRAVNNFSEQPVSSVTAKEEVPLVWGFTGAAVFLRRKALNDVAINGEIFDEDLFAYREDVDLSWRLRLRNWDIVGSTSARAYHERAIREGKYKNKRIDQLSWRNYYLVLAKDVHKSMMIRHFPYLMLEDLARDIQWFTHPHLWPIFPELVHMLPSFIRKREIVMKNALVEDFDKLEELIKKVNRQ